MVCKFLFTLSLTHSLSHSCSTSLFPNFHLSLHPYFNRSFECSLSLPISVYGFYSFSLYPILLPYCPFLPHSSIFISLSFFLFYPEQKSFDPTIFDVEINSSKKFQEFFVKSKLRRKKNFGFLKERFLFTNKAIFFGP